VDAEWHTLTPRVVNLTTNAPPPQPPPPHRSPPGAPRVNLVYLTDCLLSHARGPDPSPVARGLPQMVGTALLRMLQLSVTDRESLPRVKRALDAWGRKGLLEARYLKLGYERVERLAGSVPAVLRDARSGGGDGKEGRPGRARVRGGCGIAGWDCGVDMLSRQRGYILQSSFHVSKRQSPLSSSAEG
jgi:hypothetical protein